MPSYKRIVNETCTMLSQMGVKVDMSLPGPLLEDELQTLVGMYVGDEEANEIKHDLIEATMQKGR